MHVRGSIDEPFPFGVTERRFRFADANSAVCEMIDVMIKARQY